MSDMKQFHNLHKGETCVVIGNGPSLDRTPLERFPFITLGSNQIYRKPFIPDYYCVIDKEMAGVCSGRGKRASFIRAEFSKEGDYPIYPVVVSGFSVDIENFVVMGGTVTYALLQIAFYMGFGTVLLVGVDHNYPLSGKNVPGSKFVAGEKDPDHFLPADGKPYFLPGVTFNSPEINGTTLSYKIAKDIYSQAGRGIINLTPGTKLEVFPKGKMEEWLTTP